MSFKNNFCCIERRNNFCIIRFVGIPSDVEFQEYLTAIEQLYVDKCCFIALFDASKIGNLSLTYIRKQAEFMIKMEDFTRLYMKRVVIIANPAAKLLLQILFKIKTPACDLKVFTHYNNKAKKYLSECPDVQLRTVDAKAIIPDANNKAAPDGKTQ